MPSPCATPVQDLVLSHIDANVPRNTIVSKHLRLIKKVVHTGVSIALMSDLATLSLMSDYISVMKATNMAAQQRAVSNVAASV